MGMKGQAILKKLSFLLISIVLPILIFISYPAQARSFHSGSHSGMSHLNIATQHRAMRLGAFSQGWSRGSRSHSTTIIPIFSGPFALTPNFSAHLFQTPHSLGGNPFLHNFFAINFDFFAFPSVLRHGFFTVPSGPFVFSTPFAPSLPTVPFVPSSSIFLIVR